MIYYPQIVKASLMFRKTKRGQEKCPQCKKWIVSYSVDCPKCGHHMPVNKEMGLAHAIAILAMNRKRTMAVLRIAQNLYSVEGRQIDDSN